MELNKIGRAVAAVWLLLSFVVVPVTQAGERGPLEGTWVGTIQQPGEGSYPGVMIMLSGELGTSAYPGIPCGGILRGAGDEGSYRFSETITYGHVDDKKDGCIDGTIDVEVRGETMRWSWNGEYQGEKITASAVLRRLPAR